MNADGEKLSCVRIANDPLGLLEQVAAAFFVSMCQNRTASLRATATVATLAPRRARIRSAKACNGPGALATTHADSTRAKRAPADPCLEMLPCRAGESPD